MTPRIRYPFIGTYPITFRFGEAPEWYTKITGYPHNGLDFGMKVGTLILTCDDGRISYADNTPDANGLGINITHDWGMSQYWHLSQLRAKYGDVVKRGDTIALSGVTGWCTGPHLHFGIKVDGDTPPGMRGWTDLEKYFSEPPLQPSEPVISPTLYLIKPGDSLWKIAEKFYGDGCWWPRIYEANKDKIKNPTLIFPFQRIVIP